MKAENSGLEVSGSHRRNAGRYFSRTSNSRYTSCRPAIPENPFSSMIMDRPPLAGTNTCEAQFSAARAGKVQLTALGESQHSGRTIADGALSGLKSIGVWDATGPQDWGQAAQRNNCLKIYFVETGNMAFSEDERSFNLGAGDFTIARPWQLHQLGDPHIGPGRVHWLSIDLGVRNPNDQWRWPDWIMLTLADLAELTQKLRRNKIPVRQCTPEIVRIFQDLAKCVVQWSNPHSISRMIACLNQLFVSLLDMSETQRLNERQIRNSNHQVVEAFLKGLQENPVNCEEFSSLKQMAEHCGMGITAFAKHTREFANVGPMEFLKQCRLNHAARQLRQQPGASITDVCFSNGFNSSQYFATCFRKQFKMSPTEFVMREVPA